MNGKDFAIGVLSVTAVILLVAIVIVQTVSPNVAMAQQGGVSGAGYVVTSSRLDDNSELVVVLDSAAQKMNFYGLSPANRQLMLVQQIDLRARGRAR
jgi:hypothetical protein